MCLYGSSSNDLMISGFLMGTSSSSTSTLFLLRDLADCAAIVRECGACTQGRKDEFFVLNFPQFELPLFAKVRGNWDSEL
jgi:hypothetical protein